MLGLFALLMSFNSLLVFGVNVSMLVFVYMVVNIAPNYGLFNLGLTIQNLALVFALGVLISALDVNTDVPDAMKRAFTVLPNYFYWVALIIIIANLRHDIDWFKISRYIFIGLCLSLVFYTLRKSIDFPFIKNNTPNSYAFILVCFSAISVAYVSERYNKLYGLIFLSLLLLSLLSIERRAGFVLVGLSSMAAMYLKRVKLQYLATPLIVAGILLLTLQLDVTEAAIQNASPRIYELIYENDDLAKTDQSYLTRKLMIERGMVIFEEHPLTGIGMNNYAVNKVINTEGEFEGAELVLAKAEDKQFSAHNSYLLILIEGGLFLLVPLLMLFAYNFYHFVKNYNQRTQIENAFYWSFTSVCIHLYFIAEIVNVYAWFLFAAVGAISAKYLNRFISTAKKTP